MKLLTTGKADFLETVAKFEGQALDYNEFFPWRFFWAIEELLDKHHRIGISRNVLGGRQISKSTSLSGEITVKAHEAFHRMLYIAPQSSLTKTFSNTRLTDMLETPIINRNLFSRKSHFIPKDKKEVKIKVKDDVLSKRFVTGSYINLTYSDGTDTGRIRGYSADDGYCDEAQNATDLAAIHHVMKYCLRSSKNPRILNTGTPLGDDDFSTMTETDTMFFVYHITCPACNKEQDLRNLENIDPKGRKIVCKFCNRQLFPSIDTGRFIATNPEAKLLGMHANMLMLPSLRDPFAGTWDLILDVYHDTQKSESEKKEELLGVTSTAGEGLINKQDLDRCPRVKTEIESLYHVLDTVSRECDYLILGIDWGGDSDPQQRTLSEEYMNSHTALAITGVRLNDAGTRIHQKVLWEHTFPIEDPNVSLKSIFEIIDIIAPKLMGVAADSGGGFFPNPQVSDYLYKIDPKMHFIKVQMLPALKEQIAVCEGNIVKVYKPAMVTEYFRKVKMGEVFLAGNTDNKLNYFYKGLLSQRRYIDKSGRRFWKKRGKFSDDVFYAANFAYVLGLILCNCEHEIQKNING